MTAVIERAIIKGRIGGVVNTRNMFVMQIDYGATDTRAAVWTEYINNMINDISAYISNIWQIDTIAVQSHVGGSWIDVDEFADTVGGLATGEPLANLVAGVLIGKAIGKRLIGRKFWSPVSESAVNGNTFTTAALAAFTACAVDYIAGFTSVGGSTCTPGIWGKDNAFHAFATGYVSSLLGTIRRRKPGRGT